MTLVSAAWCAWAAPGGRATAQAQLKPVGPALELADATPSALELARTAKKLASADEPTRLAALDALRQLQVDALPAIRARLRHLAEQRPPLEAALSAMTRFRTVQGSTRADDDVDLAAGIAPVLKKRRDRAVVQVAEPLLYLRALESMNTTEAGQVIVGQLFALEDKVWRWESQRTLQRLGAKLLPALWVHQTHKARWVRRFCRFGIDKLGLRSPGRALRQDDPDVLAATLRAYGATLHFPAMPSIVSFVGSPRSQVRDAARWAIERFGRNAIWQIREGYLNATGRDADPGWGHKRALSELYAWYDKPRKDGARREVRVGVEALGRGDIEEARAAFDRALVIDPSGAFTDSTGPAYAQLGEHYLHAGALRDAHDAFARALRLSPRHPEADRWRARLVFIQTERRLAEGLVDLAGYQRAANLDPALAEAAAAVDQLSGAGATRRSTRRKAAGLIAALLLSVAALLLLRTRPTTPSARAAMDDVSADSAAG